MLSELEYGGFVDLVYEAAVEPALWVRVLEKFADLAGGAKAWMPTLNLSDGGGDGLLARIEPERQMSYFEYYASVNPFFAEDLTGPNANWPLLVVTDEDLFLKEDFVRTEYYNDFLRPQDIYAAAIVRLSRQDDFETTLNLSRPERRGQFTRDDIRVAELLQPHVVRALKINQSLGPRTQIAAHLADVLDQSPHGLFLLDAAGVIRHANREAERLLAAADGLCSTGGQLSAARAFSRTLEQLIRRAASPDLTLRSGGSMSITTPLRAAPISVTVAPLRPERFGAHTGRLGAGLRHRPRQRGEGAGRTAAPVVRTDAGGGAGNAGAVRGRQSPGGGRGARGQLQHRAQPDDAHLRKDPDSQTVRPDAADHAHHGRRRPLIRANRAPHDQGLQRR